MSAFGFEQRQIKKKKKSSRQTSETVHPSVHVQTLCDANSFILCYLLEQRRSRLKKKNPPTSKGLNGNKNSDLSEMCGNEIRSAINNSPLLPKALKIAAAMGKEN